MQMPKRPEPTSWWRIVPALAWGYIGGSISLPVYNIPANDPDYFWRVNTAHAIVGMVAGLLVFLVQKMAKMHKNTPAIYMSGFRMAGVTASVHLVFGGGVGAAMGGAMIGFLYGMGFYWIERGIAKIMPEKLGGDPQHVAEVTAKPVG